MSLVEFIRKQLLHKGDMPFVEFMHHALYAPGLGYYSSGLAKFGEAGDFITAPELTPLFGKTLANQCQEVLNQMQDGIIFEFGAGSGQLCIDVLLRLEEIHCLPCAYHILEVSGHLRQRQEEHIKKQIPHLANRIHWLHQWPEKPFNGVVLANEVLDAMPVHRFMQTATGIAESHIGLDEHGKLYEHFKPCSNERLIHHIHTILPKDWHPYVSEANLFLEGWIQACYTMLHKGLVLLIDYGFPRHEYYHPDRHQGTLMCHYRHEAHSNPLLHPGAEDITAHVDFTHVAEVAHQAGFHVAGFTNQASFLLSNGLLSLLADIEGERLRFTAQQAVKQLVQPSEMGELFKVIALTKHLDLSLTGFQLQDKRASL